MPEEIDDQGVDDGARLPSHEALFLDIGLYDEFDLVGDWSYVKRLFGGPEIQFDCYCVLCERDSTFRQHLGPRGSGSGTSLPKDQIYLDDRFIHLDFRCRRDADHHYFYVLEVRRQAISKIGQSPSLATIAAAGTRRFTKVLPKTYVGDLNRAIGLFAHGIGAGSFVYLRRIFEHLLTETAEAARAGGDSLDGFENLHMDQKVKALSGYLPKEVVEAADIYSVLSAGIHALTDEHCLALFPVMRSSIEYILDGHLAAKMREEHQRDLKRAIGNAKTAAKAATSGGNQ